MKQQILRIINSYNFEGKEGRFIETKIWNDIYAYNLLQSTYLSKSKSAAKTHNLILSDEILLLIQNGISEKDTVILTENFISIAESNIFSKNIVTKISWTEISSIKFINHSLVLGLKNGETQNFDIEKVFSKNKEKANALVELLQRILSISKGGKETIVNLNNTKIDLQKHKKTVIAVASIAVLGIGALVFFISNQQTPKSTQTYTVSTPLENNLPKYDTIWSDTPKKDYAEAVRLNTVNVFNEPYEITMEAHKFLGLIHDKGDRIIIPVEIPQKTIYWIYRMNLTNAKIEGGYTKLINEVDTENKGWTIIDALNPINKEKLASSVAVQLLNRIDAPSKEKPFTNAYFISNEKEAKKFQSGLTFDYDINNSIKNTHSRNGLIKFNKNKFVYLALENEGYSDNIYVNLEVVALTENTKYFKIVEK